MECGHRELGKKGIPDTGSCRDKDKPRLSCLDSCVTVTVIGTRGELPLAVNVKMPEAGGLALRTPISSCLSRSCLFLTVDWFAAASSMRCQIQTAHRG